MKKVYTCFCTNNINEGHLKFFEKAKEYGEVIVGVLSDSAMVKYNSFPYISLENRIIMVKEKLNVEDVVVQNDVMYDEILKKIKPDYVIHGDNWKNGPEAIVRQNVIDVLKRIGGELIEVAYNSEIIPKRNQSKCQIELMPEYRRKRLRQLLKICPIVKSMEVHNGLSGIIVEKTVVQNDNGIEQFDAMWISSLCDSTAKGKPDIEIIDMSSRIHTVDEIMEVTTKPIIFDGDTGGHTEHFVYNVRTLERMGVSAVIIEDKTGLKRNSLFGVGVEQKQEDIDKFCKKIMAGKNAQRTEDFMIIARIESLILEKGMEDALNRAHAYVEAGADGIMIHSRKKEPFEIFEFCDEFRKKDRITPLVVVPTTYNSVNEDELIEHGVNIVVYANQLMRSAVPVMIKTAEDILKNGRAFEVDYSLMDFNKIISLVDDISKENI